MDAPYPDPAHFETKEKWLEAVEAWEKGELEWDGHFNWILDRTLAHEGGWVETDNEHDRGGHTFAGISQNANPDLDLWEMLKLTGPDGPGVRDEVRRIYKERYWDRIRGTELPTWASTLMFDMAVNMGVGRAIETAQRASGAEVDRIIGPQTIEYVRQVAPEIFRRDFTRAWGRKYARICQRDPSQLHNFAGWVDRFVKTYADGMIWGGGNL